MSELKYYDLISPTLTPDEYINLNKDKPIINSNLENYTPKSEIIEKIQNILKEKNQKLKIVVLGADWCPDCTKNVPYMIKIMKTISSDDVTLQILYGIMVNAIDKPGEPRWHKKRSPPEAVDPKFDLKAIPTFYFFNKTGDLIGTIVENPKWHPTLEEDMLEILEKKL
ncbi:MAG: thioredoxin domain-containing protein [Promethearchaeota archaeon]